MKNVKTDTVIRTVITFVAMLNSILTMMGKNPIPYSSDQLYLGLSSVATVVTTIWAWWKNNSFTSNAIKADNYFAQLKESTKAEKKS